MGYRTLAPDEVASHVAAIDADGFTIVEDAIEPDLVDALADGIHRLEADHGVAPADNDFEGSSTIRIYNLLAKDPLFAQVPVHPNVLPIVEGVLDDGCLISSLSSIDIGPGETAQPIHSDDILMPIPKPHPATVCNSMWALSDFTAANGATRLVPASHLADDHPEYGGEYDTIAAEMAAGSVLVWHGSLWHGGGANTTGSRRLGLAMNYCAGYIRQQENQQLGIPLRVLATFEPRLQQLVGLGTYKGLIGHIDKQTASQALFGDPRSSSMVWDA